jgi:arylsulfatase
MCLSRVWDCVGKSLLWIGFVLSLNCLGSANEHKPLNILLLYADDWRHDTLGCAGNPIVQTPQLDRLARNGIRFTHHCVTTSICGVSRASLLTGQWMTRHGNRAFAAFKTPWDETFPGLLRHNGYFVGHVGKWHNGAFPADKFDFGRDYSGTHWITQTDGSQIHVTQKNESDALEFLRDRPVEKPFCLTVAFFATHAEDGNPKQYSPQATSLGLYQDSVIPLPKTATEEHFRRLPPFIANEKNEGRNRWHWRFDTSDKFQVSMKNYYRLASEVDASCGRILDELQRLNLLESTLVIFTTDNGYFHAEHGLADKWYPYEESIRVPLIVSDPRMRSQVRGSTRDALTLNVDLAPMILAAANISPPKGMQGRDLGPLYLDESPPTWREEYFYEHATIRDKDFIPASQALVRKDWKYILWPEFQYEELFDLTHDPLEENNLAANPAFQKRLVEMRASFRKSQQALAD